MSFIFKLLLTAVAVIFCARLIPGVQVNGFFTAVVVAIALALLNTFLKPILVFLTFPITIITLGLFYLMINVIIIYIAARLIDGFSVSGFLPALLFSFGISIVSSILSAIFD
jgi:putative membrane protein